MAEGSALPCCLLFLPNRNDMAPASQPVGRYNGSGCRSHTHPVCTGRAARGLGMFGARAGGIRFSVDRGWGGRLACVRARGSSVLQVFGGGCAHVWYAAMGEGEAKRRLTGLW